MAEKKILRPPVDDIWKKQCSNLLNKMIGNVPADSTATTILGLRADFNALLSVLRDLDGK